jgi:hypothetical protein
MILVILPLGKEARQVLDWVVRVIMYTIGSVIGAMALSLVLALIGRGVYTVLPGVGFQWAVGILGVASLVFALKELNVIKLWTPQIGWQVPKSWMKHSRLLGQTAYGVVLGAGIFTYIPFASFFILLAWEAVAGAVSIPAAIAIGAVYGAVRGLPAIIGGISMLRGEYPLPVSNWLIAHLGWWHAINGLALLFVGSFLLGSFVF